MNRDDLVDLNAFLAVAEERSFTRAAARLGLAQSTLSHTVTRLEQRLGVRLLARTTRSVAPTEAGEALVRSLVPAFETIQRQLEEIGELRSKPAGTLRITAPTHAAQTILLPAALRIMARYPEIHIEISVDSGLRDIVEGRFDAGIRIGEQVAQDMVAIRIGPDLRMAVAGSPDYLRRHGIPQAPQDLAGHNCLNLRFTTSGGLYAWELERDGRELNVRVDGQFVCNDARLLVDAAVAGNGLAFVVEDHIAAHVASGALVRVMEDWCPPFPGYHLYYPSRRQVRPAFAILIEALRYRP